MGELEANRENNRSQEDVHENWNRGSEVYVVGEEITIKGRIQEVEKLAAKICQDKIELNEDIAKSKCDRSSSVLFRLEDLNEKGLKSRLAMEREKMNILQLFLLRLTNKAPLGKPEKPFMPREEISKHKMNFRMVHGTNSLADEKQLVKEMNVRQKEDNAGSFSPLGRDYYYYIPPPLVTTYYLRHLSAVQYLRNQRSIMHHRLRQIQELQWQGRQIQELQWQGNRPGIVFERQWDEAIAEARASANPNADANAAANAIATARIWDSLSSKKALQEQIKVTGEKIEELMKSLTAVRPKVRKVERELKAIERDIEILEKKLPLIDQRKDEAYQCILKLKNQQSDHVHVFLN